MKQHPAPITDPPAIKPDGLYTDEDVCQLFGISLGTLRARLADGRLACYQDGNWRRYSGHHLLAYLQHVETNKES